MVSLAVDHPFPTPELLKQPRRPHKSACYLYGLGGGGGGVGGGGGYPIAILYTCV